MVSGPENLEVSLTLQRAVNILFSAARLFKQKSPAKLENLTFFVLCDLWKSEDDTMPISSSDYVRASAVWKSLPIRGGIFFLRSFQDSFSDFMTSSKMQLGLVKKYEFFNLFSEIISDVIRDEHCWIIASLRRKREISGSSWRGNTFQASKDSLSFLPEFFIKALAHPSPPRWPFYHTWSKFNRFA